MKYESGWVAAAILALALGPAAGAEPVFSIDTGNFYEAIEFPPDYDDDSEFVEVDRTWDAANAAAQNSSFAGIPGHLATITSAGENGFVSALRGLLPNICPENCGEPADPVANSELWIGGSQLPGQASPGDGWLWLNGEGPIPGVTSVSPYANWNTSPAEPNDGGGGEDGVEDFLALGWGGLCPDGQCVWNDNGTALYALHGYVVEYEYTPPEAVGDDVNATSGIVKKIKVLDNDVLQPDREAILTLEPPTATTSTCGVPIEVEDGGSRIFYDPPSNFVTGTQDCPTDDFQYRVTDENGAYDVATVQVTVLANEAEVDDENTTFSNQASNPAPNSANPLTGAYQQVLDAGKVKISCCRVLDTREGAGNGGKYGLYLPTDFDIGLALDETFNDCAHMPDVAPGTAILKPWHRGIPLSEGIVDENDPPPPQVREHDLGVCVIEADAGSKGVAFTVEQAKNLLGYKLDYGVDSVDYRPFTGAVSLDPVEVDAPVVIPITAETDESQSGKRFSDNLMVVNLWHDRKHNDTKSYLSRLAASLKESINAVKFEGCVDNSEGFLDDLFGYANAAQKELSKKGNPSVAMDALDAATRLALLIGSDAAELSGDPYDFGNCAINPNPQGLFVGRMMALRFAICSEDKFPTVSVSTLDNCNCFIPTDIRNELPDLEGFEPLCPAP